MTSPPTFDLSITADEALMLAAALRAEAQAVERLHHAPPSTGWRGLRWVFDVRAQELNDRAEEVEAQALRVLAKVPA